MSGGSFNYLCHTWDLNDLMDKRGDLEEMASELAGLGYAQDAARETEELLVMLRQWEVRASVRLERLREVWKAVEWWRSCDYSEDQVREALAEYRGDGARTVEAEITPQEKPTREHLLAAIERVRRIPRLPHHSQQTGDLGRAYTRGWESVIAALDEALDRKEQP